MITWPIHLIRAWSWQFWSFSSLAVLLGGLALFQSSPEKPVDTRGWEIDQFVEHLKSRGVELHVHAMPRTAPVAQVILSEDPNLTWQCIQKKPMAVEYIDQWRGTVSVWQTHPDIQMDDQVVFWGRHGCQIGDFVLFGDERILLRVLKAFGQ